MTFDSILVTGGTGFIGQSLLAALEPHCKYIYALKREQSRVPDALRDVKKIIWLNSLELNESNFLNINKIDFAVHLATNYFKDDSFYSELEYDNVIFPLRMMESLKKNGCSYFINTDSFFCKQDSEDKYRPEYTLTKNTFREWGRIFAKSHDGFNFINVSLEHIYGPHDGGTKFIPWVSNRLLNNLRVELTTGNQERDFTYITDVVAAYMIIISNLKFLKGYHEFEVGTGAAIPLKTFILKMHNILGSKSILDFGVKKEHPFEIQRSQANNLSLRKLGWSPLIDVDSGIRKYANYLVGQ